MTALDGLIGHDRPIALLRGAMSRGQVHHAWLFHGPEGVGKGAAARAFAAALVHGEELNEDDPRAHAFDGGGTHADLWVVRREVKPTTPANRRDSREEEDLRKFIAVEQIRKLSQMAGMSPREGKRRCFLIDPADRMNLESQNALLKTLEEPPGSGVLILVASRPRVLLPTVRSRCFQLDFHPVAEGPLVEWLIARGIPAAEARERAALAEGRPGRALELDLEERRERRDAVLESLEQLTASRPAIDRLPGFAAELAGKDESTLIDGLDLLQALLRDASRAASGAEGLIHSTVGDRLSTVGQRLGARRCADISSAVDDLRTGLRSNLNRLLVAESLLAAVSGGPLPTRR